MGTLGKYIMQALSLGLLGGCAAPQVTVDIANVHLVGICKSMFLDGSLMKYQYVAQAPGGRASFALATSSTGGQACGIATNRGGDVKEGLFEIIPPWEKVDAMAIARCEAAKLPNVPYTPCKIFAHNNQILWGVDKKVDLE